MLWKELPLYYFCKRMSSFKCGPFGFGFRFCAGDNLRDLWSYLISHVVLSSLHINKRRKSCRENCYFSMYMMCPGVCLPGLKSKELKKKEILHDPLPNINSYTDDTQLYISSKTVTSAALFSLTNYLTDMKHWMICNFLI